MLGLRTSSPFSNGQSIENSVDIKYLLTRNGMDLTEAEDIKSRWQEYTELYKKDLHDSDNHDGVITHLEPDIL